MNAPGELVRRPPENLGDPDSFQRLLKQEKVPVPEFFGPTAVDWGNEDLDASRYYAPEFHQREIEHMWPRVWQFVAREEAIPRAGDHVVYNIGNKSLIIMRGEDGKIRALGNSCLHRGLALRPTGGSVKKLYCPFHGFTWDLQGAIASVPCSWDFKHLAKDRLQLPEARVESWAGFIFINFDRDAPSLKEHLGVVPEHFERYNMERSCTIIHVQKRIPCNWKVAQEAFFESFHVRATHPHIMTFTDDVDSQYDVFGENVARCITPMSIPSPNLEHVAEQRVLHDVLEASGRQGANRGSDHELPPGLSAREYVADLNRRIYGELSGDDLSGATMAELQDAILYSVFPNFQVWAGYFGNIVYRALPDGNNPESCIFDVLVLGRYKKGEACPPAPPVHRLADDAPFSSAPELGALGPVFDQDMSNLPHMNQGLKASLTGKVSLASYQELRIRAHHRTLDKYLGL